MGDISVDLRFRHYIEELAPTYIELQDMAEQMEWRTCYFAKTDRERDLYRRRWLYLLHLAARPKGKGS